MRYVLLMLALLVLPTQASATDRMRVTFATSAPVGFIELCRQKPQICVPDGRGQQRVTLSKDHFEWLSEINAWVNRLIEPTSDIEKYPKSNGERWELLDCLKGGDCRGDCEEYVLLKRQFLIDAGWPVSALLMTVVRTKRGEGHLVLTVRTSDGDYILDNHTDEVRIWHETPHTFESRQSYLDPKVWYGIATSVTLATNSKF